MSAGRSLRSLREALVLGIAGSVVAVITDLALPGGVLGRTDEVLFHVESLVEVRLLTPEEVRHRFHDFDSVLVDVRSRERMQLRPFAMGTVEFPVEEQGSLGLQQDLLAAVATRDAIVVFDAGQEEEARRTAQDLVLEFSASTASTVEGGADALWPLLGEEIPEQVEIVPEGDGP